MLFLGLGLGLGHGRTFSSNVQGPRFTPQCHKNQQAKNQSTFSLGISHSIWLSSVGHLMDGQDVHCGCWSTVDWEESIKKFKLQMSPITLNMKAKKNQIKSKSRIMFSRRADPQERLRCFMSWKPLSTYMGPFSGSSSPAGHAAKTKWQVTEQRMEKEVRHPVRQRRADLPPQFTCEYVG